MTDTADSDAYKSFKLLKNNKHTIFRLYNNIEL